MSTPRLIMSWAVVITLLAACPLLTADQSINLFDGTSDVAEPGPWGSGEIKISEWAKLGEQQALEIVTQSYHEGGRLDPRMPIDFGPFVAEPIQTQVIALVKAAEPWQPWGAVQYGPEMGPGVGMPGMGMPGMGMPGMGMPGMGMPGMGMPGMGMPGMGMPGMPGTGIQPYAAPALPVDKIRIVLVTDKGQLSSGALDLNPNLATQEDWLRISAVLSDFRMPADLAGATLERVVLTGNRKGTFYVVNLQVVQEDVPLVAQIDGPEIRIVPAGQPAQFTAWPQHEGVDASFQWDFDDLDGIGIDGYEEEISHRFPEPGYYVITLRVVDRNGQLQPRVDTIKVKVQ